MSDETHDDLKLITHELTHASGMKHVTRVTASDANGHTAASHVETGEGRTGVPRRVHEADPFELCVESNAELPF